MHFHRHNHLSLPCKMLNAPSAVAKEASLLQVCFKNKVFCLVDESCPSSAWFHEFPLF